MANSDFIFKITSKEADGKYSVVATANQILDEELCKKYSASAITEAKQLKAKHGEKYSDAYYLEYGKSLVLKGLIAANREIHKNRLAGCDIKDIDWAVYSYEEIIAMEADGYQIPDEVLQWAHAQHQADVTDYVIVSDTTVQEDNVTDATGSTEDELSNLKKKAKQNIAKTDKALDEMAQDVEKYNEIAEKAQDIKEKKEDTYKDTMSEISSKTEEWKQLDEKKKAGKLSKLEEKKYKDLSKQLNGKNGTLMQEIQVDNADLDEFLTTLNGLDTKITENIILAQDTIKAGKELGEYEKNYNSAQLPAATSSSSFDENGDTLDTLYGVKGNEEISELAIEKGTELDQVSNNVLAELTSEETRDLTAFADDYTELATQTENNTKEAMGENYENNQNPNEATNKKDAKGFNVDVKFTAGNAKKAALTTAISTATLIPKDVKVDNSDEKVQKELKKAQKDSKNLEKEANKSEQKLASNLQKEEEMLLKLEELRADKQEPQEAPEETEVVNNIEENPTPEEPSATNDDKNGEKQTIKADLETTQQENSELKQDVSKALNKSSASTSKGQKLTKDLTSKNTDLNSRNKNAQDVAEKTTIVGAGTTAKSFITTAIGNSVFATGQALLSNPFTIKEGIILTILGTKLIKQGKDELTYGLIATGTGVLGLAMSDHAGDTKSDADVTIKEANKAFKLNNQEIKEASKVLGEGETSNSTENNTSETQAPEGTTDETNAENNTENQVTEATEETTTTEESTNTEQTPDTEQAPTTEDAPKAEETPETNETDNTKNTEEPKEENPEEEPNTQQAQPQQNKQNDEGASVDMRFNTVNALKATATTISATDDMIDSERDMSKLSRLVRNQTRQSQTLMKNIDSETAKAVVKHQANMTESETITSQHATAQTEAQNAQTEEELVAAQAKMTNLSTQLDATADKDADATTSADKTISNSIRQLAKFRTNTSTMNKDLSALDKTIKNQLDVAVKTTAVGIGTTGVGIIDNSIGTGLMISGLSLMSNPFTFSIGAAQLAAGEILVAKGALEISSGALATATGTAGVIANAVTNDVSKDSDATLKAANTQNKELEKKAGESYKELDQEPETTNETENTPETEQPKPQEEEDAENEILTLSASASANANIGDSVTTDDKADRKLSRFNTESIIESKKKMKKVVAVSSSSRG